MSLQIPKLSHRVKLTGLLTVAVSVALALVFSIVIFVVREQTLSGKFTDLERNVKRVSEEWSGPPSLAEEHEDFPHNEFTVFRQDGSVVASTTKKPLERIQGQKKVKSLLYFGVMHEDLEIVGATSLEETESGFKQLAFVLACLWLPLTALTALVAWYGGGLVLRPVTELVRSADSLSSGSKTDLLKTSDEAEFAALADSLNLMISRIRKAAELQEQFASDAAHELRSPLALLRTRVETTLLNEREANDYREALHSMLGQIERLTSIVETLLASARESNQVDSDIDLQPSVQKIVDHWRQDATWGETRLEVNTEPCNAKIAYDELRIVLNNILDNAARFSPADSPIIVRLEKKGNTAHLTIRDFGPGFKEEDRTRAFDRFYRVDQDRNRDHGGAGIGLSVVKRIIESRHGTVEASQVDTGALISLSLPAI